LLQRLASTDLPAAGVQCLLIGGFAVNHYGYTRNALDSLDFKVDIRPLCDKFGTPEACQMIRRQIEGLRSA
jgi:hypothetical protein